MITNAGPATVVDEDDDEQPRGKAKRVLVVRKAVSYKDPDTALDHLIRAVDTRVINVDAKLFEGERNGIPVITHYRSLREVMKSPLAKRRVRDAFNDRQIKELAERMVEITDLPADVRVLKEAYDFNLGLYGDESAALGTTPNVFRVTDTVLPTMGSPYSKQMTFVDYLEAHRRCFEAAVRNPIGKRICKIVPQFVLGRGVKGSASDKEHQAAWDDFYKRNAMRLRIKQLLRELVTYGEIFLRYFNTREGLVLRSLDPMTIWDVVTSPDDLEEIKYYHQQYVILNNAPAVTMPNVTPSTLIIRHIPAREIDHFKINSTSSEKRGRSELYAILGWLQRFKEFANDRVLLNKMRAMFALDVSVGGGQEELDAAGEQFATPPGPGAVLIHNDAIKVDFRNANNNANEAKTDGELILKIIAVGAGISEQFLGVSSAQTRAGALIQTEPDVKNFEDYREIVEQMLMQGSERVWKARNLRPDEMEFTFPSIAQEDRSAKLKDLALMEAMDWFTKERSATMAAREFEVTTFSYKDEREAIRKERGDEPVIATGFQQLPKIAPAAPGGEAPGLIPEAPGQKPEASADNLGKQDVTQTSGQMGFRADRGGRGLADTKPTLNRSAFTRGGEKAALKGDKTSGTPLMHSAEPRRGWPPAAREASLATRRRKAQQRRELMEHGTTTAATPTDYRQRSGPDEGAAGGGV